MRKNDSILLLISEIQKHIALLDELKAELDSGMDEDIKLIGKTRRSAGMIASIIESYYTCGETVFLRISQFFENRLSEKRWHKDLLEKMVLDVKDIRPRVITDEVFHDLQELLRFRHFKRYYFTLSYDWERLGEILRRINRVHTRLLQELKEYNSFLESLLNPGDSTQ